MVEGLRNSLSSGAVHMKEYFPRNETINTSARYMEEKNDQLEFLLLTKQLTKKYTEKNTSLK